MIVCDECFEGFHKLCIGQGCYCKCQLDDDEPISSFEGDLNDDPDYLEP